MDQLKQAGDLFANATKAVKESLASVKLASPDAESFRVKIPEIAAEWTALRGKHSAG